MSNDRSARRTVGSILGDTAFATLGATRYGIAVSRSLARMSVDAPRQLVSLPFQAPEMVRAVRDQSRANARATRERWSQSFDELSLRGRELVGAVRRDPRAQQAAEQVSTARSQVRAATTSVGRSIEQTAEAAESAARTIGRQTEPANQRVIDLGRDQPPDYQEMTLEELREHARQMDISGRSDMNKSQLVRALQRQHRTRGARTDERLDELTLEELRERARSEDIEGRSDMNKAQLVRALQRTSQRASR